MTSNIDYYKILEISPDATPEQIRKAYKVQALKTHPDRVPSDHPDRPSRTRKFQLVNEAFRTLSNPTTRRDYDRTRPRSSAASGGNTTGTSYQDYASSFFNRGGSNSGNRPSEQDANQFSDIFEEMMEEEGFYDNNNNNANTNEETRNMFREGNVRSGKFWGILGAIAGAILGFILANFAGMVAGFFAGNQLGGIRDRNRGKSVYQVFSELPQADKARVLSDLAARVFAHAVSG